jgi:hypothetical protein
MSAYPIYDKEGKGKEDPLFEFLYLEYILET